MQENEDYDTYITEDGSIPLSLDTALLYGIDAFFMNDWEEEGDASRIASPETPLSAVQETAQKESEKEMFIVFPNPAKDQVNIMLTLKKNSPLEVEIVDMQGKQVYNDYIYQASPGTNYIQLTKLDLPTGTYMLKVKSQESERQKKLIIIESK